MYLHLGQSVVVAQRDIIGIFDLDNSSYSRHTRAFLEKAEKEGRVISATDDLPKSFALCQKKDGTTTVYLSQLSSATLKGRAEGPISGEL
jgi:hypothetical protein